MGGGWWVVATQRGWVGGWVVATVHCCGAMSAADAMSERSIATTEVDSDTSEEATRVKEEMSLLELWWDMPILSLRDPVDEPVPRRPVPVDAPEDPTDVPPPGAPWRPWQVSSRSQSPGPSEAHPDEDRQGGPDPAPTGEMRIVRGVPRWCSWRESPAPLGSSAAGGEDEPTQPLARSSLWRESLEERWDAARVAARGLPVAFHVVPDEELESFISHIVSGADAFYVGATTDPKWRWAGGESERGFMQGHRETWNALHVLHLSESKSSRSQETRLIQHFMKQPRCHNRKPDARGQVRDEPNFIYVALR